MQFIAGASAIDITPKGSLHLAGYPYVRRTATGVHDPLMSSALFLSDGQTKTLFIANDAIFVSKDSVQRVRRRIYERTKMAPTNILISATHTHSGPSTVAFVAGSKDPLLPPVDSSYVHLIEEAMIEAACGAFEQAQPAEIGLSIGNATGIGTNRHDPLGPSDLEVPVLLVRNQHSKKYLACLLIVCMHPTVLHEDSTLYSGDFPGVARQIIQKDILHSDCPVLYHTGPSGNQSPRHVTRENNFGEAYRLANILAQAVDRTISQIEFSAEIKITCNSVEIDLPKKNFPGLEQARSHLEKATLRLNELKKENADKRALRTAEVDWFGANELLHLVELSKSNALKSVYKNCLPAEIQLITIGLWSFVAWPGEIFVEYGLEVKKQKDNVFIITLANGELQGYIVTPEAAAAGGYEASNAIFELGSGAILVNKTLDLLNLSA